MRGKSGDLINNTIFIKQMSQKLKEKLENIM
jgi:hypothetical protein